MAKGRKKVFMKRAINWFNPSKFSSRWFIFWSAVLFRSIWGLAFWGGCDLGIWQRINVQLLEGTSYFLPYFPFIEWFIWIGGILAVHLHVPIHFCYKIFPIIFDALNAVLVYDLAFKMLPSFSARRAALLYAFSPLAVFAVSLQAQWDSISIFCLLASFYVRTFFTQRPATYFAFGMLFVTAFLVKPITIMFFPFFFLPYEGLKREVGSRFWPLMYWGGVGGTVLILILLNMKMRLPLFVPLNKQLILLIGSVFTGWATLGIWLVGSIWNRASAAFKNYLTLHLAAISGVLFTLLGYLIIIAFSRFDMIETFTTVLRHMNRGTIVFGFPFMHFFKNNLLGAMVKNRIILLAALMPLVTAYYLSRLSIFAALFITYLLTLGLSGLLPHYFIWPLVLLLGGGFYRLTALYNLFGVIVGMLYYLHPEASSVSVPYQNAAGFLPLKALAFLTPSSFYNTFFALKIFELVAHYLIPLFFLFSTWYVWRQRNIYKNVPAEKQKSERGGRGIYLIVPLCTVGVGLVLTRLFSKSMSAAAVQAAIDTRQYLFNGVVIAGRYAYDPAFSSSFNVVVIMASMALIWSILCFYRSSRS